MGIALFMYETVIYWSLGEAYILCGSVMRSVEPLDPMDSIFSFFSRKRKHACIGGHGGVRLHTITLSEYAFEHGSSLLI